MNTPARIEKNFLEFFEAHWHEIMEGEFLYNRGLSDSAVIHVPAYMTLHPNAIIVISEFAKTFLGEWETPMDFLKENPDFGFLYGNSFPLAHIGVWASPKHQMSIPNRISAADVLFASFCEALAHSLYAEYGQPK